MARGHIAKLVIEVHVEGLVITSNSRRVNCNSSSKMASRAVMGVVGAAAGLHYAHERYQDHLAEKEQEERAQRREDYLEGVSRRAAEEEEERRYREATGGKRRRNRGGGGIHTTRAFKSLNMGAAVDGLLKEMLVDMVEQVKAEAAATARNNRSRGALDDGRIHLPLLDTDRNSPDEIALGAALAFGSQGLVDSVIRAEIVQPGPGTALARLTTNSVRVITEVVLENCTTVRLGKASLGALMNSTVLDPEREMKQGIRLLGKVVLPAHAAAHGAREELRTLQKCASSVGLHAIPAAAWSRKSGKDWRALKFIYDPYYSARGEEGEEIWITNFTGSFTAPAGERTEEADGRIMAQYDLTSLQPLRKRDAKPRKLTDDDLDAAYSIAAKVLATKAVDTAVAELLQLWRENGREPLSLEHIAARSGYDGNLLTGLRKNTAEVLSKRSDYLFTALSDQLLSCVPPPGRNWNNYWHERTCNENDEIDETICGYVDKESAAKSYRVLEREVAAFVQMYNRLVDLSYCLVPVNGGKRPSDCVPRASVYCRSKSLIFEIDFPSQSLVRSLVFDERERLRQARELSAPSAFLSAFCIFTMTSILFWLSYEGMIRAPMISTSSPTLVFALAGFLALTCLSPTLGFLDGPLHVKHRANSSMPQRIWTTTTCLCERLRRALSVWRGLGTPFEREVRDLMTSCEKQQRIWLQRCCERDFYRALHRTRIDSAELELLLMAMATKQTSGHVEGVLPGGMEDANAFLDIEVNDSSKEENMDSIEDSARGAFASIGDAMKTSLDRRVLINKSVLARSPDEAIDSTGQEVVLYDGDALSGIAILSNDDITLVRVDEINALLPVPTRLCSFVRATSSEDFLGIEINGDESESDTEEVFNEDDDMKALQRARHRRTRDEKIKLKTKKIKVKTRKSTKPMPQQDEDGADNSEEAEHKSAPKPSRHQTVREALKAGGWELIRMKNHLVYRRKIKSENGGEKESHQTVTVSKTPSDWRTKKNILSNLRRLDEEVKAGDENSNLKGQPGLWQQCSECHENMTSDNFSKNQLKRENPRCKQCVGSRT